MIPKPFHACAILGCCLLLVLLPFQSARAESKPLDAALELQTLEDFHAAGQIQAHKPVNDVDASYRYKLEKFQKTAQADGNLKSVVAAKRVIEDLDASRPLLTSDEPGVADIQTAYTAQRQKAVAESEKALAKVDQDHLASLKDLVVKLTKAGQIDQALEVQAAVDKLNSSVTTKSTPVTQPQEAQESDIWKKKALEEFPALQDSASELARNVKTLKEKKESMSPSFFKNPQWPYLLAKEANFNVQAAAKNRLIPAGAKCLRSKRYFFYQERCTWKTAKEKCEEAGGQLAVIQDEATQEFIKELAGDNSVWLGATDEKKEGEWLWVDGTPVKYRNFNSGEPNNARHTGLAEHYLVMCSGKNRGKWSDVINKCPIAGYICEWTEITPVR